ncbi:MAG: tetratricopeptide repeat protein [Chloroflexi bacterium]|nr:tetratricopeptide repeat protein [Chloroflexota bacterium]
MRKQTKILWLVLMLLLASFALPAQAQRSDCYDDGVTALADGDYEEAIDQFTCAIEDDPENGAAYWGRASAYILLAPPLELQVIFDLNQVSNDVLEEAVDDLADQIDDDPERIEPYVLRAFANYWLGSYEDSFEDCNAALDIDDNSVCFLLRGVANQHLGETRDAEDDFEQAFEMDDSSPVVYELIAFAYFDTGEYELAVDNFSGAIDLVPDDAFYYLWRGWSFYFLQEYNDAIDDFDAAIDIDPDYAPPYFRRGLTRLAQEDFEAAADDLYLWAQVFAGTDDFNIDTLEDGDTLDLTMEEGFFYAFEFEAEEGQSITITVEGRDDVDPLIALISPDGDGLMVNDDRDAADGDYNAEIEDFEAPESGTYLLLVMHSYVVIEGDVEVSLELRG